jgi:hypothetical protein
MMLVYRSAFSTYNSRLGKKEVIIKAGQSSFVLFSLQQHLTI